MDRRRILLLKVIDDREMLAIEADLSLTASRLIKTLDYLRQFRGLASMIKVDNCPEFISHLLDMLCKKHQIQLTLYNQENEYLVRCNGNIWRGLNGRALKSSC